MPQQDKIKYFNFLLENGINFSRDESGNYVALVKVLNPAFYGGAQNNVNKANLKPKEKSKKNSKAFMNEKEFKNEKNVNKSQPKKVSDINKNFENEEKNALKSQKNKISSEYFEKDK